MVLKFPRFSIRSRRHKSVIISGEEISGDELRLAFVPIPTSGASQPFGSRFCLTAFIAPIRYETDEVTRPGSNAVDAAAGVKKLMAQMKERFPEDLDFAISLDTTRAVTEGIKEIVVTLLIALALVILVVYLFLQGWRATLIPLLAVPVSLVGTFVLFPLFGFSINTLSMFALVLAIGLVVDDAIVVVEGVERHIEEGLTPRNAALKAMEELSGPVVGIALVLSAVFVPTAFIPGI